MDIQVDDSALKAEAKRAQGAAARVRKQAWAVLRKVGLDTVAEWKRQEPVDTGRSRASIGKWDDRIRAGKFGSSSRRNAAAASDADSIYDESEADLRVTAGSNLPYIEVLNAGHSNQAPAGFIDVIAAKAETTLADAIAAVADAI